MSATSETNPEQPKEGASVSSSSQPSGVLSQVPEWGKWAGGLIAIFSLAGAIWVAMGTVIKQVIDARVDSDAVARDIRETIQKERDRTNALIRENSDKIAALKVALKNQDDSARVLEENLAKLRTRVQDLGKLVDAVGGDKEHLIAVIQESNRSGDAKAFVEKTRELREQNDILVKEVKGELARLGAGLSSLEGKMGDVPLLINKKLKSYIQSYQDDNGSAADGHLRVGDVLICWGRKRLAILPPQRPGEDNANARAFEFTFGQEFAAPPTVANGILPKSSGHSFSVYNHEITTTKYFGGVINNPPNQPTPDDVTFEYIAIGRAKQ